MVGQFNFGRFPIAVIEGGESSTRRRSGRQKRNLSASCAYSAVAHVALIDCPPASSTTGLQVWGVEGKTLYRRYLYRKEAFSEHQHPEAMQACDRTCKQAHYSSSMW
jgi:hypothetical protein